jgi:uncharacterized membrane protein YgdD (TMEM256/DUF423 family)
MMIRIWLAIAGLGGAASVMAGAAAAHLGNEFRAGELLRNGSLYGMVHAAALLAVCAFAQGREPRRGIAVFVGWCFAVGIVLFSLAQFAHAVTGMAWFAWGVPFGGTAFILGWAALALLAFRRR